MPSLTIAGKVLPTLKSVINNITEKYDGFDIRETSTRTPIECGMALWTDNTDASSLEDSTLMAVGGTVKTCNKAAETCNYMSIVALFNNNPLLKHVIEDEDISANTFTKKGDSSALMQGDNASSEVKKGIKSWLSSFVHKEVIEYLDLNNNVFSNIFSKAPLNIDKRTIRVGDAVQLDRKLIDVSGVRFPHVDSEQFYIFNVEFSLLTTCSHIVDYEWSQSTMLHGSFKWKRFSPRLTMIAELKEQTKETAKGLGVEWYTT